MLSPSQIRRLPADPFGFLPLIHSPVAKSPFRLLLIKDENHCAHPGRDILEITETQADSQKLLEFYLRRGYGTSGTVKSVGLRDVLACTLKVRIALPSEKAKYLNALLRQIRVDSLLSYYAKRPWQETPMGKHHYLLLYVFADDRSKVRQFSKFLRSRKSSRRK
jgi:hypothetical protein